MKRVLVENCGFVAVYRMGIEYIKVKVKQSRYRPGVAQRVPRGLVSQISMTFGTRRW